MKTILLQGDSITEGSRNVNNPAAIGRGYCHLVAARLGFDYPAQYHILNRGISGDRAADLYARVKKDLINLAPDYLSILIGVNDVWHEICWQNGADTEKFERLYCMILEEVFAALPNIRIMLMEPYVLLGSATENTEEIPDKWERFQAGVHANAQASRRVAEKFGLPFVPLQQRFNDAAALTGETLTWTRDGVHPVAPGHELIARAWLEGFEKIK